MEFCVVDKDIGNIQNMSLNDLTDTLQNTLILLVEDNELNQEVITDMLASFGAEVVVAGDGQQCLDILKEQKVNAILMDCQMPVMDGYEATRKIREQAEHKGLPILALSADVTRQSRERMIEVGMNDFIPKPFRLHELVGILAKWLKAGC